MGRVRERKRGGGKKKNREKERKKKRSPPEPLMEVRPLELSQEALDIGQRLKTKIEAVKFNPPRILS
jgi:hypothetical protein